MKTKGRPWVVKESGPPPIKTQNAKNATKENTAAMLKSTHEQRTCIGNFCSEDSSSMSW
eukprot:CAMPEP_0197525026 /NCGR_PEP_ID=MMETSP1318-20131121/10574_1 /TAXON_ID=552666 /ORGANISM="Partenskyella glossopodia, Strain RCC365" /LENGTH=58 /DNA_ID=CAMNT_0043078175 /DNA_START=592 /DNA_END=765 /DNA_ORIENTATION=-